MAHDMVSGDANERNRAGYRKATEPYIAETIYCICIDVAVIALLYIAFLVMHKLLPDLPISTVNQLMVTIMAIFFGAELLLNYNLAIRIFLDKLFKKTGTDHHLFVNRIAEESSWSGWLFHSILPKLYSNHMERYKVVCRNHAGRRVVLRLAMSPDKYQILYDLYLGKYGLNEGEFFYLKSSRIIYKTDVAINKYNSLSTKQKKTITALVEEFNRKR